MPQEMNTTSTWINDNWIPLRKACFRILHRRMPTATAAGMGEDFFHAWLVKIISRDTLASYLEQGKQPELKILSYWCYQYTIGQVRVMGQDPVLRQHGFKTHRDLNGNADSKNQEYCFNSCYQYDKNDNVIGMDLIDPNDVSPEEHAIFVEGVRTYEDLILRRFRSNGRMVRVFRALMLGYTRAEINNMEGVNTTTQITRMRRSMSE